MAPVKKKGSESINSRLALVMKSGKYTLGYRSTLKTLRQGKPSWSSLEPTHHNFARVRSSTMQCYLKLVFIITQETTLNWEQLVENTSECQFSVSRTLEILISSDPCQLSKLKQSDCCIV